ncbi:MAG TPA: alanine racemase [Nitrospiria bacterium]|jgi:alanine racemase
MTLNDSHGRPTWAEINLKALSNNIGVVRGKVGEERKILAVVKADAYGHGLVPVSKALLSENIQMFGVAQLDEGIELRQAGIQIPILLMTGFLESQLKDIFHYRLTPVVHHFDLLSPLQRFGKKAQKPFRFHLKIDTGMGRLGMTLSELKRVAQMLKASPEIFLEGIMTHFAESEGEGGGFLKEQTHRFLESVNLVLKSDYPHLICHAANSAAIVNSPSSYFQMVRPGIMLYGYLPPPLKGLNHGLMPVMSLKTKIIHLKKVPPRTPIGYGRTWKTKRESLIATLPIGYADGYPRLLSNRGSVLMRGKKYPIVGRICMDLLMVDVTGMERPEIGETVVLIGEEEGKKITADEIGMWAETISYEILCGVNRRIPRVYLS